MIKRIYRPTTDLDKRLLASIPQKIFAWASLIDPETITPAVGGNFDSLYWYFDNEDSSYVSLDDASSEVRIVGPLDNPTDIYGFESWMEDISNNLEQFTLFEKSFYDVMEQFAKEKLQSPMKDFVETTNSLVKDRHG